MRCRFGRLTFLAAALLICARLPAAQERWQRLPNSAAARQAWRTDSTEADFPTVWLRSSYRAPRRVGTTRYDRDEQRFAVDCSRQRVLWLSTLLFLGDDFVLRDHREQSLPEEWEGTTARPVLRLVLKRLCAR